MKLLLPILLIIFSLGLFAQDKAQQDAVVADVNGVKIKMSTLLSYHEQNLKVVRGNKTIDLESSLNDLIDRVIGIQNGTKNNINKRPDVVKKMNDIIYHAHISDEIAPKLKKIKVDKNEIKNYYEKNPEYKTSQILLRLRAIPSQDEVAKALELSLKLYNELQKDPKKFEELARQHSQVTTANMGGDIGYQPRVRLSTEYFEAIEGKRIGYITQPFRTQYGIHIVKVTGKKEFKQIDEKLYEKILYDVQRDKILADYFEGERKKANIKINKKKLNI